MIAEAAVERDRGERACAFPQQVGGGFDAGRDCTIKVLRSERGAAEVINTFTRFHIILTNAVKYVTSVDAYDRRIQSAINIQGRKMQRRAEFLLTHALRQAGWK